MQGASRAAILLIALGTERASQVFQHLTQEQVGQVSAAISRMPEVAEEQMAAVLGEANAMLVARRSLRAGGVDYARAALQRAFGGNQAEAILQSLAEAVAERPFAFVRQLDAAQVASVLSQEHAQTVALVAAHLLPEQAAEVLTQLPAARRMDVVWRMAQLGRHRGVRPETVADVAETLNARTATIARRDTQQVGGVESLAAVLTRMRRTQEQEVLEGLRERDADLATEIEKRLFTFDDLARLDQKTLMVITEKVDTHEDLPLALKAASREVRMALLGAVSEKERARVQEAIEFMGRRHIQEVEAAQQRILAEVRQLEAQGQIHLEHGEADVYV